MNDVLLAPQEWMKMQTAIGGATLLQQQAEWHLVGSAARRRATAMIRPTVIERWLIHMSEECS